MTEIFTTLTPARVRRQRAERRFQLYGKLAIGIAIGFLALMIGTIAQQGSGTIYQTKLSLDIQLDQDTIDPKGTHNPADLKKADYRSLIRASLRKLFPDVTGRRAKRKLYGLVSPDAEYEVQKFVLQNPKLIGTTVSVPLIASDDVDIFVKGRIDRNLPESERRVKDNEISWIDSLQAKGQISSTLNWTFLTNGDSREPELAGIFSAFAGSALTLLVCFLLSFPLGLLSAIYLEEFAPKNRWNDFIEVNINNLAAVPSIVFGLLGLAIFLNVFNLPRSSPLVGGMVLALMTLPTIIIASRAALRAVPPSIREAALGMGATRVQTTFHHVAPLAMPGMLTGTIVGMAQALGETAPLLMIGMVAFIVDAPTSILEPATALPVQIFLWADSPERAFVERTSAAIIVLLVFLIVMNLAAIMLRKKFERRY